MTLGKKAVSILRLRKKIASLRRILRKEQKEFDTLVEKWEQKYENNKGEE